MASFAITPDNLWSTIRAIVDVGGPLIIIVVVIAITVHGLRLAFRFLAESARDK